MARWTQPRLDGGAIRAFHCSGAHRFGRGYTGSFEVLQEGGAEFVTLVKFTELDSEQLASAVRLCLEQLMVMLGEDG